MMDSKDMATRSGALRAQMLEKLGVKSVTLAQGFRRAGRRLPRRIRARGKALADAEAMICNPKLARQLDAHAVLRDFEEVSAHLRGIDVADRRKGAWLQLAGAIAANLLAVGIGFLAWLFWRGYI